MPPQQTSHKIAHERVVPHLLVADRRNLFTR